MPRFYFNLRNGFRIDDPEGVELQSIDEAREFAIRSARSMMAESVKSGELSLRDFIEITDGDGRVLARVDFRASVRLLD